MTCSWLIYYLFMNCLLLNNLKTCPSLIHDFFMTYYVLFMTCAWIANGLPLFAHDLVVSTPLLVNYFFITCSSLVHDLFKTYSGLVNNLFRTFYLLMLCSQLVHELLVLFSWLINVLFTTCSKLFRTCSKQVVASLSLAQLSPSLFIYNLIQLSKMAKDSYLR